MPVKPDHSEIINDKQIMSIDLTEEVGLPPLQMYKLESFHEHVHREVHHLDAVSTGPVT